jgi:hypothetical protein
MNLRYAHLAWSKFQDEVHVPNIVLHGNQYMPSEFATWILIALLMRGSNLNTHFLLSRNAKSDHHSMKEYAREPSSDVDIDNMGNARARLHIWGLIMETN